MESIESQKKRWGDKGSLTMDVAYRYGDPDSHRATYNKQLRGDFKRIKDEYLLPYIKDKVVLEIGCGCGKWTQFMGEAKHVIGLDLTEDLIYELNKLNMKNFEYIVGSGHDLKGIEDDSIDYIFSIDSLLHLEKVYLLEYINEFKRVLKKDGSICINLTVGQTVEDVKEFASMFYDNGLIVNIDGFTLSMKNVLILKGIRMIK